MTTIRTHYLDASAIVKIFLREQGTEEPIRKYFHERHTFFTTWLCFAETLQVFKRKFIEGELSLEHYLTACNDLMAWMADEGIVIDKIEITNRETYSEVEELAENHVIDIADAYLIVALKRGFFSRMVGESKPILITADTALTRVARQENVRVWNCVQEPPP